MDSVKTSSNGDCSKIKTDCLLQSVEPCLLPGLPDAVAISCLARVPRKYHPVLNCVSKRWRELVASEEWFSYRLSHHLEETWIYSLCKDKSEQLCMYALDPNQFRRGWKRIHSLPGSFLRRQGIGFEVYDPSSRTWQPAIGDLACWCGPGVEVDGVCYLLIQSSGVRLMMWRSDTRECLGLRRLPEHVVRPPCQLIVVEKKIFVVGKGLNTLMFDVESAICEGRALRSSVLKYDCDDEVTSCTSLAI